MSTDDSETSGDLRRAVVTIRQSISNMAGTAIAMLSEQVRNARNGQSVDVRHHQEALTLVEWSSTGKAPGA